MVTANLQWLLNMTDYKVTSSAFTDVGLKRSANEDSIYENVLNGMWVVADGMGGFENGSMASKTAVEGLAALDLPEDFESACDIIAARIYEINSRIYDMSQQCGQQMGTTAAVLLIRQGKFAAIWVGDSRVYVYRRGGLFQLTVDHTHVQDLVDEGLLSPADAESHSMSHVLTRALGVEDCVSVDIVNDVLEPGDIFLICSDGLTGPVDDEQIRWIISDTHPEKASRALLDLCYENGAPDNISIILVSTKAEDHVG